MGREGVKGWSGEREGVEGGCEGGREWREGGSGDLPPVHSHQRC